MCEGKRQMGKTNWGETGGKKMGRGDFKLSSLIYPKSKGCS